MNAKSIPRAAVALVSTFPRGVVDFPGAYTANEHGRVQPNVENILNKECLAASVIRFTVWPGAPTKARLRISYAL